ncbi:hypothetical protein V6R21_16365 [Limibacter armeniacum]|uniref:hypothetical protein n=1 Tax=Limibacter armeniacum TaxID=466084 RepID=UPI002FE6A962
MTSNLYADKFVEIVYDAGQSLLIHYWYESTSQMSDEDYQKTVSILVRVFQKYKPLKCLAVTNKMQYVVTPELQKWVSQQFLGIAAKYNGIVVSENIFTLLSVEQLMEELDEAGERTITRYFTDQEQAEEWLLSI